MTTDELKTWEALNKCECVKKVFCGLQPGDRYYCMMNDDYGIQFDTMGACDVTCDIWVPPLYDPIRPERSLWGMSEEIREEWSIMKVGIFIASERPDLFLAEMIIEQEGK